jgi:hypothetical protein
VLLQVRIRADSVIGLWLLSSGRIAIRCYYDYCYYYYHYYIGWRILGYMEQEIASHARKFKQHEAWLCFSSSTVQYVQVIKYAGHCLHKLIMCADILNIHRVPRLCQVVIRNHEN